MRSLRPPLSPPALLALLLVSLAARATATPLDFIPVGDPLEDELRLLDVLGGTAVIPRLGLRPLQVLELPDFNAAAPGAATAVSLARIRRALARDRSFRTDTVPGATPRLFQLAYPEDLRFEGSLALEGRAMVAREADPALASGSGVRLRLAAEVGRWLAYSHVLAGNVDGGLGFSEALFPGGDAVLHSEEAFLAYTAERAQWGVQLGRNRWHWGPGREASLLLSKTSAPLTGMALHFRMAPIRADGMILSATLDPAAGEQLAAHRAEWQPLHGLRLGVSEAARYQSDSWEPLYWAGVLPYALVQNLLVQDEPESTRALRDNVMAAVDAAWRIAPGSRLYGEVLIDDLKTDRSPVVSKYGWQIGWEGAGMVRGRRVTWGTEFTRLTRFVYTSFFGRAFTAQDRPLGFPTGPDARRVTVTCACDLSAVWQIHVAAARTDRGESGLTVPFVPGTPGVQSNEFAGVVETTREAELGVRWWPASGIDMTLSAGYRWVDDVGHVAGPSRRQPNASLGIRIAR